MSEQERSVVPGFVRGYRFWSTRARPVYSDDSIDPTVFREPYKFMKMLMRVIDFEYLDHRLYGAWKSTESWKPGGVMVAKCVRHAERGDHESPDWECTCGLYAKYLPEPEAQRPHMIGGVIDAWGSTILGNTGFRAEKAVIRGLWVGRYMDPRGVDIIGGQYGVPVFDEPWQAALEFPPTEVTELIQNDYDLIQQQRLEEYRRELKNYYHSRPTFNIY